MKILHPKLMHWIMILGAFAVLHSSCKKEKYDVFNGWPKDLKGEIVFEGSSNIHKLDSNGSHKLTSSNYVRLLDRIKWSPDGSTILYSDRGRIFTLPANGGEPDIIHGDTSNIVYHNYSQPVWSPDGLKIAYIYGNDRGLYVSNRDGTNEKRIATAIKLIGWSKDNDIIYLFDGDLLCYNFINHETDFLYHPGGYFYPELSPDGKQIVYVSSNWEHGESFIHLVNVDGSDERRLTTSKDVHHNYPSWAPDGKKIAFTLEGELCIMNTDGSDKMKINFEIDDFDIVKHMDWKW